MLKLWWNKTGKKERKHPALFLFFSLFKALFPQQHIALLVFESVWSEHHCKNHSFYHFSYFVLTSNFSNATTRVLIELLPNWTKVRNAIWSIWIKQKIFRIWLRNAIWCIWIKNRRYLGSGYFNFLFLIFWRNC